MKYHINQLIRKNSILLGILGLLFIGCEDSSNELPDRSYRLVWEDNFDGASGSLPDGNKWAYDIGTGVNGWGNQELQYYTNSTDNIQLDGDGNLVITAREERVEDSRYTSARIKTQGIFEQTYGRFEARIKTPFGPGIWPAFWLLGNGVDDPEIGWPLTGEIDIMELRGQEPSTIAGTVHGPGYSGAESIGEDFTLNNARFDTDFYVFAVEWGVNYIDFFVDDILYQRITPGSIPELDLDDELCILQFPNDCEDLKENNWVFDHDFFIILNLAVGGSYVGPPNDNTRFPQTMTIDYVRVYEEI